MKRIKKIKLYNNINNLKNIHILTGWGGQARYDTNTSIGYVMYLLNYGYRDTKRNLIIPARPFMENCINKNYNKWKQTTTYLLSQFLNKKLQFNQLVNQMSLVMVGDLEISIQETNNPPNAPRTIKKKGFNKPLVDTGTALGSITSEAKYV